MDLKRRSLGEDEQNSLRKISKLSFFRSYGRNWGKICFCNALLLICNPLSMLLGLIIVMFLFPMLFPFYSMQSLGDSLVAAGMVEAASATPEAVENLYSLLCMMTALMLVGCMFVINGPIQSAICYYYKNLLTGEANFKSDFKKGLKENWKMSLGASAISVVVLVVLVFNAAFYQNMGSGIIPKITRGFFACLVVFWAGMQIYIYPLIATVELRFREVYKNALLLSVMNFPSTMGIVLLEVFLFICVPFVCMISFGQIGYAITMLLYILFSFGFIAFLSMFRTWKSIQKWISQD